MRKTLWCPIAKPFISTFHYKIVANPMVLIVKLSLLTHWKCGKDGFILSIVSPMTHQFLEWLKIGIKSICYQWQQHELQKLKCINTQLINTQSLQGSNLHWNKHIWSDNTWSQSLHGSKICIQINTISLWSDHNWSQSLDRKTDAAAPGVASLLHGQLGSRLGMNWCLWRIGSSDLRHDLLHEMPTFRWSSSPLIMIKQAPLSQWWFGPAPLLPGVKHSSSRWSQRRVNLMVSTRIGCIICWQWRSSEVDDDIGCCCFVISTRSSSPSAGVDLGLLLPELVLVGAWEWWIGEDGDRGGRAVHIHTRDGFGCRCLQAWHNGSWFMSRVDGDLVWWSQCGCVSLIYAFVVRIRRFHRCKTLWTW